MKNTINSQSGVNDSSNFSSQQTKAKFVTWSDRVVDTNLGNASQPIEITATDDNFYSGF